MSFRSHVLHTLVDGQTPLALRSYLRPGRKSTLSCSRDQISMTPVNATYMSKGVRISFGDFDCFEAGAWG